MAVNEVYQVVHHSTWGIGISGETATAMTNAFYYRQTVGATADAASVLRQAFGAYFTLWADLFPEWCRYDKTEFVNIARPTDFYQHLGEEIGNRATTGDPVTPALCAQWVSNRGQPGTRSARKRYSCLAEGDVLGKHLTSTFLALSEVTAVAAFLNNPISNAGNTFAPVVAARPIELGVAPTVRYTIAGGQFQSRLSSQNTRKD